MLQTVHSAMFWKMCSFHERNSSDVRCAIASQLAFSEVTVQEKPIVKTRRKVSQKIVVHLRPDLQRFRSGQPPQASFRICWHFACRYLLFVKNVYVQNAQFRGLSPLKNTQIHSKMAVYKEMEGYQL